MITFRTYPKHRAVYGGTDTCLSLKHTPLNRMSCSIHNHREPCLGQLNNCRCSISTCPEEQLFCPHNSTAACDSDWNTRTAFLICCGHFTEVISKQEQTPSHGDISQILSPDLLRREETEGALGRALLPTGQCQWHTRPLSPAARCSLARYPRPGLGWVLQIRNWRVWLSWDRGWALLQCSSCRCQQETWEAGAETFYLVNYGKGFFCRSRNELPSPFLPLAAAEQDIMT